MCSTTPSLYMYHCSLRCSLHCSLCCSLHCSLRCSLHHHPIQTYMACSFNTYSPLLLVLTSLFVGILKPVLSELRACDKWRGSAELVAVVTEVASGPQPAIWLFSQHSPEIVQWHQRSAQKEGLIYFHLGKSGQIRFRQAVGFVAEKNMVLVSQVQKTSHDGCAPGRFKQINQ